MMNKNLPASLLKGYDPGKAYSRDEALKYCEYLAKSHYENFTVASWFLPAEKKQDFYNIYSYCRWSDDLGDEVGDKTQSLELLDWWEQELDKAYIGKLEHPVFIALIETIKKYDIPIDPFKNLLVAFKQDQRITRYPTFQDLLGYCENSANPVGHLVLYLCGYKDTERQKLSDYTCTALQLTNFWQDVTVDWKKDRIYIPLEDMQNYGYAETELGRRKFTPAFAELMKFEVNRTRELFNKGLPLCAKLDRKVRLDIELFSRGGMAILNRIEAQGYDVFKKRPALTKSTKITLMFRRILEI